MKEFLKEPPIVKDCIIEIMETVFVFMKFIERE